VQASRPLGGLAESTWWLAGALTFWSCGYALIRGDDLWWHLAAGRWMLAKRALTRTDEFSFTAAGAPWLNDAWLGDVIFATWEHAFGTHALAWWKWGLVTTIFLMLFATLRRVALDCMGDRPADGARSAAALAAYVGATLGAVTAGPFLDMRPQLYTFLGVALVLHGTMARDTPGWWLPLVFVAWANLHAGFVFGLGCLGLALAPWLRADPAPRRRALGIGALAVGACLLNPYGPTALTRPLRYAFDRASPFHALAEWWPPFRPGGLESPFYPFLLAIFALTAMAAVVQRQHRRRPAFWVGLALGGGTLAMSLTSRRFVPLFAVVQSLTVVVVVAPAVLPLVRRLPALAPALAALVLGGAWLAPYPQAGYAFHYLTAEDHFPIETANFIETNGLSGNVFAQYAWAGYLQMRTAGRMKVYVDGRADAVYPDEVFVRYEQASLGKDGWIEIIEGSAADWILWPRNLPWGALPRALLSTGRWRQVHVDAVAVLLQRLDETPASTSQPPPTYQPTPASPVRSYALGALALDQGSLEEARREFGQALAEAPYLRRACNGLAIAEARAGEIDMGRATLARCESIFPIPARVAWFEEQLATLAGALH